MVTNYEEYDLTPTNKLAIKLSAAGGFAGGPATGANTSTHDPVLGIEAYKLLLPEVFIYGCILVAILSSPRIRNYLQGLLWRSLDHRTLLIFRFIIWAAFYLSTLITLLILIGVESIVEGKVTTIVTFSVVTVVMVVLIELILYIYWRFSVTRYRFLGDPEPQMYARRVRIKIPQPQDLGGSHDYYRWTYFDGALRISDDTTNQQWVWEKGFYPPITTMRLGGRNYVGSFRRAGYLESLFIGECIEGYFDFPIAQATTPVHPKEYQTLAVMGYNMGYDKIYMGIRGQYYAHNFSYALFVEAYNAGKDATRRAMSGLEIDGDQLSQEEVNWLYHLVTEDRNLIPFLKPHDRIETNCYAEANFDQPQPKDEEKPKAPDQEPIPVIVPDVSTQPDSEPILPEPLKPEILGEETDRPSPQPREPVKPEITIVVEDKPVEVREKSWYYYPAGTLRDESKPLLRELSRPFTQPSWGVPCKNLKNLELMVNQRYDKHNQGVDIGKKRRKQYEAYMDEFADMFPTNLKPFTSAEVHKQQNRPAQQQILKKADAIKPGKKSKKLAGFVKAEAYPEPKPLRPIISMTPQDKENYSMYLLALGEHMKTIHWYAFGKNMTEVGQVMGGKAFGAKAAFMTDFTAFDVTVNEFLRFLERKILVRCFGYKAANLHRRQLNVNLLFTVDEDEVEIKNYYGRQSGSAETSTFNTAINAFVAYATLREMNYSPQEAWKQLGLYGGDDGVSFDMDAEKYKVVAQDLGLKLKLEIVERGKPFNFLARTFYSCVWDGRHCSLSDPQRLLGKAHLSTWNNINTKDLLALKAYAFQLSDSGSIIVNNWSQAVLRITAPHPALLMEVVNFMESQDREKVVFRGVKMQDLLGYNTSRTECCDQCGREQLTHLYATTDLRPAALEEWLGKLQEAQHLEQIPMLRFGLDKPFSKTWEKCWGWGQDAYVTEGTEEELPVYPARQVADLGYFSHKPRKKPPPKVGVATTKR